MAVGLAGLIPPPPRSHHPPLSPEDERAARDLAARSGLTIEEARERIHRRTLCIGRPPYPSEPGALVVVSDENREAMRAVEAGAAPNRISTAESKRERRRKRALENEAKKKGPP